jgi:cobalt-zinc-cadmium efflux system membrane fusion protein
LIGCLLGAGAGLAARRALAGENVAGPELVPGTAVGLRLPPELPAKLRLQTGEVKPRTAAPRVLELIGTLGIDPDRVVRVLSRFPGEVIEGGLSGRGEGTGPIRYGDRVKKGQLLAVVWSKELAEKKGELVDALAQLRLDQESLTKLEELYRAGNTTEAVLRQVRRNVTADQTAVARAERTLRVWRLTDEEIQALKTEADKAMRRGGKRAADPVKDWARVEIRAPMDGVIVEKNVVLGSVVGTTAALFQLADLSHLVVYAHVFEPDTATLNALKPERRRWTISPLEGTSFAPVEGTIDEIGYLKGPNQHTVVVKGHLVNPEGRLRPGQAVRLTVTLSAPVREVVVPASALVEEGGATYVFVQPDARERVYVPVRVEVVRRGKDTAHVRSDEDGGWSLSVREALGGGAAMIDYDRDGWPDLLVLTREGLQRVGGRRALRPGDRIVTSGAVELKALLHDLKPAPPR